MFGFISICGRTCCALMSLWCLSRVYHLLFAWLLVSGPSRHSNDLCILRLHLHVVVVAVLLGVN